MAKQRKCYGCGAWNEGETTVCLTCGKPLDEYQFKQQEQQAAAGNNRHKDFVDKLRQQAGWIDRFLERTTSSTNVFVKGFGFFLQFLWMVYFSILLFVAWLVFVVAG